MQFNSYSYLICLLFAVIFFWCLPVRFRRAYVLAVSFGFYATWNVYFLGLPLLLCGITYLCAQAIRRDPENSRRALLTGIGLVVAILGVCKYSGFAIENLTFIAPQLKTSALPTILAIGMPLGISFYSFEAISYLLDTRQGRVSSASFMDLCLFVVFWPHLIAGPIVRSRELIPQLKFSRPFERKFILVGLDRLILGLFQKNLIANNIGSWVDDGFLPKIAAFNTTIDNWTLAVAFGLQIYFDFAAYSNMAIGAAQMIGITLPENFRFPYLAGNPVEFWTRWHMTLSRWIRDYVFFPLNAGFQDSKTRLYLSLVGVMGIVGLWHGAGWGYIVWGLMHGVYLAAYRIFEDVVGEKSQRVYLRLLWRGLTLAAIAAAWVPFRAGTLGQASLMLARMCWRFVPGISYSVNFYLVTLLFCGFCVAEVWIGKAIGNLDNWSSRAQVWGSFNAYFARPLGYALLLLLFMIFDDRDTQFIYFQF